MMMTTQRDSGRPRPALRRTILPFLGELCLIGLCLAGAHLVASTAVHADDVGEPVQGVYDQARKLYAKGDPKSLGQAFSALDPRKDEALESIDFWTLYARVWLGLKKDPNELWNVVVLQRQETAPQSAVFDLARARVANTAAKRGAAIEAALKRDPKSLPGRTAKACWLIAGDEEDEGAELLEEILAEDEHALGALLAMARLDLSDGLPEDALEYVDTALEQHRTAEVHHLKALCYQRLALNDEAAINKALASAAEAMGLEPTDARIELFSELLKATGDAATAAKALRTHFERTRHPRLGALLAESGFRAGDYEAAALGLSVGDDTDLATAKGRAVVFARLGRIPQAQAAAKKVVAMDSQGRLFAARLDLFLGEAAAVKTRLGGLADVEARRLRALAHAWLGEPDAVKALVGKQVKSGSREGEALLVAWLQALVLSRMDADLSSALRKKLLAARFAAGSKATPQGEASGVDLGKVLTAGWPRRALTWFRAPCGRFFQPVGDTGFSFSTSLDLSSEAMPVVHDTVTGEVMCAGEKSTCEFKFNPRKAKSAEGFIRLFESSQDLKEFAPAEKAFKAGCGAYLSGDLPAASAKFGEVLAIEPAWSRIQVLLAVMRALRPDAEKRDEARTAKDAVVPWTDDFELRRLVIYLRAWAGDAEVQAEVSALAQREAQYNVRNLAGL